MNDLAANAPPNPRLSPPWSSDLQHSSSQLMSMPASSDAGQSTLTKAISSQHHTTDFKGPLTPTSPASPTVPNKSKRANPLTDLVDSEKIFVEQLTGIIRVCRYYIEFLPFQDL